MTVTDIASICGLVFGVTGCVLGVMNYLRDRAALHVTLQWDLAVTPGPQYDPNKLWGAIRVTNVGRRPTYISHAALRLPKGYGESHLVIMDSIQGEKLSEGDATRGYVVDQAGLQVYTRHWRKIVAQVSDSTGKVWTSKRLKKGEKPSWANPA